MMGRSDDRGETWEYTTGHTIPDIDCPSETTCYFVETSSVFGISTDGGTTWETREVLETNDWFEALDCSTERDCVLVGGLGAIATTTDAGDTWHLLENPLDLPEMKAVYCVTALSCIAVGDNAVFRTAVPEQIFLPWLH